MAAPQISLNVRLKQLEDAKARAAKLKRGAMLSSMPMAEMLRVRWPALRDWCNTIEGFEQSGAFIRGGNGIEWEFNPRATVDYLIKHFRTRIEGQAKKSRAISKAVGVQLPEGEQAPSLAETKELVNLTMTVVSAAEKQKRFIPNETVAAFIEGYNQRAVNGILGVRTRVDPNGNLPASVRKEVDAYLRLVASDLHAEAAQFVEECREGLQSEGTGRAG
jgi:hypothetical protein